jgi:hypothetical protein
MKLLLVCSLAMAICATSAWAQSLKPEAPVPLQPGINQGTIDNFVGTHYWYFTGGPGHVHLHALFKSMSVLGNASRSQITVTLSDANHSWNTPKILSSDSKPVDCNFDGDLKTAAKLLVRVDPPAGGLLRSGGDYQLEATGAVAFAQKSTADPIIGTYNQMAGYTSLLGTSKFFPDGSIQTTSGTNGKWKLFDKDTNTYVVSIDGQTQMSLQYVPGRGLCDGETIIFQELK